MKLFLELLQKKFWNFDFEHFTFEYIIYYPPNQPILIIYQYMESKIE